MWKLEVFLWLSVNCIVNQNTQKNKVKFKINTVSYELNLTKVWYYNQGKWINENEYGKRWYYNECYDDDLDLITTGKRSGGELEVESHNVSATHEIIYLNFFIIRLTTNTSYSQINKIDNISCDKISNSCNFLISHIICSNSYKNNTQKMKNS